MGKAKRCRTVILGASVAVLGAATACPDANAASKAAPATQGTRAAVAHVHHKPRRRPWPRTAPAPHGPYVYAIRVGGEINVKKTDVQCSGSSIWLTQVSLVMPETSAAGALFNRNESFWDKHVTITAGPTAKVTISWKPPAERREAEAEANAHNGEIRNPRLWGQEDSGAAGTVCAATAPNAALGDIAEAEVTWRLPQPGASVAALLAQPATSVYTNEYMLVFEILPDGSVPSFTPYETIAERQ
jgi:hypothetical protein